MRRFPNHVNEKHLAPRLLSWFRRNGRVLPWRGHPDPYAIWVSEIMLQQTRVETAIPYFEKWMESFPNVQNLAEADEQTVLNAWEGLGYYSRARNLHKAAKIVVDKFAGKLPRGLDELKGLPGIGRYTAGAIASIAFGLDEPTLDGNLRRVFSRLYDVSLPVGSPAGEKKLWDLAAKNLPSGRAGDYNQSLMDLGAMVCIPKNPRCGICPLRVFCRAYAKGTQQARPVLRPRRESPHFTHAAAVVVNRGRVLLTRRPSQGLLGGLWEFPNARVEKDPDKELAKSLYAANRLRVRKKEALLVVKHAYTHFKVTVHAFLCAPVSIPKGENRRWVRISELEDYPMGRIDRQIARALNNVRS
jgi:A/G-specific adenine glycosylase